MSIEKDISRIADAFEELVRQFAPGVDLTPDKPAAGDPTPAPDKPAPPAPKTPTPPAPGKPAAPALSTEELNAALVEEFTRLGSREGIDKVMAEMGVASINDLAAEQYQPLLDAVRAL